MLYDDIELEVMASAMQSNLRTSQVSKPKYMNAIIDNYLSHIDFRGLRILDIGPGQCDFLDIIKEKGAITFGIDCDPAVLKLGEMRGHSMTGCNLINSWPFEGTIFDGIFCQGSINCHWFVQPNNNDLLMQFLNRIIKSLSPKGWMWILPFNKSSETHKNLIDSTREVVAQWALKENVSC